MGTRGFVGFVHQEKEYLSYNHWDSYADGLGINVLAWARQADWDRVREQVSNLRLVDESETASIEDQINLASHHNAGVSTGKPEEWYSLLRNLQGDLQGYLDAGVMIDSHLFPYDSLFAEWGYVIDLDHKTLEVYQGFQTKPPVAGRWATPDALDKSQADYDKALAAANPDQLGYLTAHRYHPVDLLTWWSLDELPSQEEFLTALLGDEG